MILRSPHADIAVPVQDLSSFVLNAEPGRAQTAALVDGVTGRAVTYGELREQVRRVAAGLAGLGVSKGDVVALCSPNSPEFAIAFHAVARLGAIVTPVNPANTAARAGPSALGRRGEDAHRGGLAAGQGTQRNR